MTSAEFSAGFGDGIRRALVPGMLATIVLAWGFSALAAVAEKQSELSGAAQRVLEGQLFGLILPLSLLSISTQVLERRRLDDRTASLARFGSSRRSIALGIVAASMLIGAIVSAVAAGATAALAHDPTAPSTVVDALTSAWIGALTAAAYVGLLTLGATFGATGSGRFWALAFDFLFGSTSSVAAVVVPRAHAHNLLGGEPPLLLSQPASAVALVVIAAAFTALALTRCRP